MANYHYPTKHGDVMTTDEFKEAVEEGCFIDYDGYGYPAKDGMEDRDIIVQPSKLERIPEDATHVVWFNR